jgi:hypothetical protein
MTTHPNTVAAGIFGALGALTVYVLNKYAGTHLNQYDSAAIATGFATARLYVGRRGIKPTLVGLWTGVWNGSPAPSPQQPVEPV